MEVRARVQEHEGLKAASQFSSTHIKFQRHKMNVKLAAQTLSASIALAIDFMRKDMKHPALIDIEATTGFIRQIDRPFDMMNTRTPLSHGFKRPVSSLF